MIVSPQHSCVEPSGFIKSRLINSWNPINSNLINLIVELSSLFSYEPPLYTKPMESIPGISNSIANNSSSEPPKNLHPMIIVPSPGVEPSPDFQLQLESKVKNQVELLRDQLEKEILYLKQLKQQLEKSQININSEIALLHNQIV
jgi:hypothetical protein